MAFAPSQSSSRKPATASAASALRVRDDDRAFRLAVLLAATLQGDLANEARANEARGIAFDLVTALDRRRQ